VDLTEDSSTPPELTVAITPGFVQTLISGDTGNFQFQVCAQQSSGSVKVRATITSATPADKFQIIGAIGDTADITIQP
jgi:hypothetical protein